MKNTIACVLILGIMGFNPVAIGQQVAPLSGPLLAKPSAAQWQLTVFRKPADPSATDSQPPAPPETYEVRSIVVQGRLRYEVDKPTKGNEFTVWCLGPMEFYKCPPHDKYFICSPADEQYYVIKPGLLFGELAWINKTKYLGIKNIDGTAYQVFGESSPPLSADALAALLQDETTQNGQFKQQDINRIAYVNVNTHLPVYSQDNKSIYVYQFGSTPTGNLTVPPEILAMLKFRDEQIRKLMVQPSKS